MEFRIADTFTDSLARLTGDEQKAVKTTAFDLQISGVLPDLPAELACNRSSSVSRLSGRATRHAGS
jgi:hypothetical protein